MHPKRKTKFFFGQNNRQKKKDKNGSKRHFSPFLKKVSVLMVQTCSSKGSRVKTMGQVKRCTKRWERKTSPCGYSEKDPAPYLALCVKNLRKSRKVFPWVFWQNKNGVPFSAFQRAVKFLGTFERETKGGKGCWKHESSTCWVRCSDLWVGGSGKETPLQQNQWGIFTADPPDLMANCPWVWGGILGEIQWHGVIQNDVGKLNKEKIGCLPNTQWN